MSATGWSDVASRRFFVAIPLPERRSWRVDDSTTPWLVARQPASSSELLARTWTAQRLVRPAECERQARLWRPDLPAPSDDTTVDARTIAVPADYQTQLVVAVQPHAGGIDGFALAFGATVGRCYALVYSTSAKGPGAETAVGRRLAIIVDGVISRVHGLRIEDRLRP